MQLNYMIENYLPIQLNLSENGLVVVTEYKGNDFTDSKESNNKK